MIGTAMMIAVIGQHEPSSQLDIMPWEVDQLENGSLRVFGITLSKNSIQEANQIFAHFGKTRLKVTTDENEYQTYQLVANYDELIIGGLIAQIELSYQIEQKELQLIYDSLSMTSQSEGIKYYPVDTKTEIDYLNTAVSSVTYIPSVDYSMDDIRQNFGQPAEEKKLNDEEQLWSYPTMGLKVFIHNSKPDRFVYAPLN